MSIKKFIPKDCHKTVFDIDYKKLYDEGKKIIIFDLDNTLLSYSENEPKEDVINLINNIKEIGFTLVILSNNHNKRLSRVGNILKIKAFANAKKPLKFGYKRILKRFKQFTKNEFICIGDQLMTDCLGASRMKLETIIVKPIYLKDEHWYTKVNRITEKNIIKMMKHRYKDMYNKLVDIRGFKFGRKM